MRPVPKPIMGSRGGSHEAVDCDHRAQKRKDHSGDADADEQQPRSRPEIAQAHVHGDGEDLR